MAKGKVKKKKKLSPEEKRFRQIQRDHIKTARTFFRNSGFERASEVAEKEVDFQSQKGEIDDAFVYENLVIIAEYTAKSSGIHDHLKAKKIIFSKIMSDPSGFLVYLRERFPAFNARLGSKFHQDRYIVRIVYCSRYDYDIAIRETVDEPIYLDFPLLKYFEKISAAIKLSSLPEVCGFLKVDPEKIAEGGIFSKNPASTFYHGSLLPDSASGFPTGFKVVSFYADPAALLKRAFVLRRDGWRGTFQAYQRMVQPAKIEAIRRKLKSDGQVFINNLIATLPHDVHPVNSSGKTVEINTLKETEPVQITLPLRSNSVGLIDGQHRLFSYYKSRDDDPQIAGLRNEQNLLVTGIIYPEATSKEEAERFEATLFLAINSNQTNAPAALRQEIEVILKPYSPTAIGKQVIQRLAATGPLSGHIEAYFFDKGKLKTTSIVSYGLGPLIKLAGEDSIFRVFSHPKKGDIATGGDSAALESYLSFSSSTISMFLNAVKANVPPERWTTDPKVPGRILTVTYVISFLITLRLAIAAGFPLEFDLLKARLSGIDKFDFGKFHSSQYGRMAAEIFETHFS